jgi:hypothetical protein
VNARDIPLWLKLGYAAWVPIIAIAYWFNYGPANFLWLSDIALLFTLAALVTENPLLASMPAVGVLPLEIAWTFDFLTGGRLIGLAAYMFDPKLPFYLRALSIFHLALPPTLLFLLYRLGYDARALVYQTLLMWSVLVTTYLVTSSEQNINWVFGPGSKPQEWLPAPAYLLLEMIALTLFAVIPTHVVLKYFFVRA